MVTEVYIPSDEEVVDAIAKETLYDLYVVKLLPSHQIAKIYGTSNYQIRKELRLHSIPIRGYFESNKMIASKWKRDIPKERLYDLYVNQKLSSNQIGKMYHTCSADILKKMVDFGIPRRELSEAQREHQSTAPTTRQSKPERMVREELKRLGIERSDTPRGVPEIDIGIYKGHCYDIKIESHKTVIEIQGCWHHGCRLCRIFLTYQRQIKNVKRDESIRESFKKQSEWKLVELWEHDINSDMTIEYLLRREAPWLFNPQYPPQ
jgi:G:T-mismatch repair DNA endonuclease (very short patch repair protein)